MKYFNVVMIRILGRLLAMGLFVALPDGLADTGDGNSARCAECHVRQYHAWQESDHARSMAVANDESVLGDFSDVEVRFQGRVIRFYRRENAFYVETPGADGRVRPYRIDYTFGHFPLQQYLIEIEDGRLQAFDIAWDSRPAEDGGQRWMDLQPDEPVTTASPFFWTRHLQNWNSRCADCHSTRVEKRFDPDAAGYDTRFSEINVGCEACHGGGSVHIERARNRQWSRGSGLYNVRATLQWHFVEGQDIAVPEGEKSGGLIDMCGGCHSRRSVIGDRVTGENYFDQYRLSLLEDGLYYADGQIRDEVFVLGSFLQSRMYARGVTCTNCHDPHSGKLAVTGNGLCAQCHRPERYDRPEHHFHEPDSAGAACIGCHMPVRTYMQVDDRRDHRFGIPTPGTAATGSPNACHQCHEGAPPEWANRVLEERFEGRPQADEIAMVMQRARTGDPAVLDDIVETAMKDSVSGIVRATLLAATAAFPSRESHEVARRHLQDEDVLVRMAAVRSLAHAPPVLRWPWLRSSMRDPARSVRFEVARSLSTMVSAIPFDGLEDFSALLKEYRQSLALTRDMPESQVLLGNLELNLGHAAAAQVAFGKALAFEPVYVPALLNLADVYRASGEENAAETLLKRALAFAPESAAVNFSYGLLLVRARQYEKALAYLHAATEPPDGQARYAWVYAVALDSVSRTADAVTFLDGAIQRWPGRYDLLLARIQYLEKLGRFDEVKKSLVNLRRIAPTSPEVVRRMTRYFPGTEPAP